MKITEALQRAFRRVAEIRMPQGKRQTIAMPSILTAGGPKTDVLPKPSARNLRRFSEMPVARRAINAVKDRIAGMRWRVQLRKGRSESAEIQEQIRILTANLDTPNPDDSFRSFAEQILEDIIVGGFGAAELQTSADPEHPLLLWPIDGSTIQMKADWDGLPGSPRYVQSVRRFGREEKIALNDDELMYARLNPRSHTPFGLGRLEVAFETINAFLSAHRYAARLASNSVVQYALWVQNLSPTHHERLIRWWQDEIEGTGRVPILSVESKPEVLRFGGGTDADLRLGWQEFLLRIIADSFDLPAQFLGVERDLNRSTSEELSDQAFRSAIVPTARLFAEHLTRDAIGKKLGWSDLEFVFTDVDAKNELEQAQIQEILLRSGVLTVNEVRLMRGLAALSDKGGN